MVSVVVMAVVVMMVSMVVMAVVAVVVMMAVMVFRDNIDADDARICRLVVAGVDDAGISLVKVEA